MGAYNGQHAGSESSGEDSEVVEVALGDGICMTFSVPKGISEEERREAIEEAKRKGPVVIAEIEREIAEEEN